MLRNCHGHNLSKSNIIKIFYHGLNEITQEVLNSTAGGIFLYITPNQAYQLLEDKVLLKLDWAKDQKTKSSLKKNVAFADKGSNNSDTDKILARMDAMTKKMEARYKEIQSRSNHSIHEYDKDDKPMLVDKQTGRPSRSLPSNTQPTLKGSSSKPYQPLQARNEHVSAVFTWSGKSYDPPINLNDQQNDSETPINFDSDDEEEESTPQPKSQILKPVKEALVPKPYKPNIPNAKLWQISQRTLPPKLGDPESFLIPFTFSKAFSCNAGADLGAIINLVPYSLYAKLSLETLKPTKMSVRLADRSFQHPIGIAKNMLVEVGKFIFLVDFVFLEMEEDSKVPLILGRPFLHIADAVIRMIFSIDSAMKHSYPNDDTCFSIDVIDEILEADFDALLDKGSKILHSIEGTILKEKLLLNSMHSWL
ncbi:reverse transcriptase domain-containing protein [Tanacetum coccineum]